MHKTISTADELADYSWGDRLSLPQGTYVLVKSSYMGQQFVGRIAGVATTCLNQMQIVECMDGTLPNEHHKYSHVSVPAAFLQPNSHAFLEVS